MVIACLVVGVLASEWLQKTHTRPSSEPNKTRQNVNVGRTTGRGKKFTSHKVLIPAKNI
jgi:hypothetical protein